VSKSRIFGVARLNPGYACQSVSSDGLGALRETSAP
jgi:hypothetical protein